jgi:hypothetical protein
VNPLSYAFPRVPAIRFEIDRGQRRKNSTSAKESTKFLLSARKRSRVDERSETIRKTSLQMMLRIQLGEFRKRVASLLIRRTLLGE